MKTPFHPTPSPPRSPPADPVFEADPAEPDSATVNLLPVDEQFERFALWLRVTDAGHQPC